MANEKRYIFNSTNPMIIKRYRIEPFDKRLPTPQSNDPLVMLGHITNKKQSTIMGKIFHTTSSTTGATEKFNSYFSRVFCSIDKISFWRL